MRKVLQIVALSLALAAPAFAVDVPGSSGPIGKFSHDAAAPLLDQLKLAKSPEEAQLLSQRIWSAWMTSGDAEIDKMVQRAQIMMQFGVFEESLAMLDAVVAKAPQFAEGWNRRATLLYMMREYDRSMADIAKVLTLEPRHFGAIAGMGLISIARGDKRRALEAYKQVLEIDPNNPGAKESVEVLGKELGGAPI